MSYTYTEPDVQKNVTIYHDQLGGAHTTRQAAIAANIRDDMFDVICQCVPPSVDIHMSQVFAKQVCDALDARPDLLRHYLERND